MLMERHGKTAYKVIKGRTYDISYFQIFGCPCFILNHRDQQTKFQAKVDKWIFMG